MQRCLSPREKRDIICRALEREAHLPSGSIMGGCRSPAVAEARWRAFALIRVSCPKLSYCQIGALFGRHHSTVMYGLASLFGHASSTTRCRKGAALAINRGFRVVGEAFLAEAEALFASAVPLPVEREPAHAIAA